MRCQRRFTQCEEVFGYEQTDDPNVAAAIGDARRKNEEAIERRPGVLQEEWLKQRVMLMEKEKQYIRAGDELAAEVRALPWMKVDKSYTSRPRKETLCLRTCSSSIVSSSSSTS
jgi:hypothetical protein